MEVFNPNQMKLASYRSAINQSGSGAVMDRYIYSNQTGEGIGSFFGNLARIANAMPLLGNAIKGAARIAKPYLKRAAADIITTGSKRAIDKITGDIIHTPHSPKSKRRGKARNKWRNL